MVRDARLGIVSVAQKVEKWSAIPGLIHGLDIFHLALMQCQKLTYFYISQVLYRQKELKNSIYTCFDWIYPHDILKIDIMIYKKPNSKKSMCANPLQNIDLKKWESYFG